MADTPRLDLPYLSASQAQKEVMHNISLDRLDLLVQCAVIDRNLTAPPASPTLGDAYIVATGATGAWAGQANALALWISSQWQFIAPLPGFTCWVRDEAVLVYWSGAAWVIASGGGGASTFLGLSDTPDSYVGQAGKAVLVNAGATALEFGTLAGSAPVDATYIVSSANTTLSAERVLTNSTSLTWNTGTAGQVSADIAANGVTLDKIETLTYPALLGRGNPPDGNVEEITVGAGLTLTAGTLRLSTAPGAADFLSLTDTPDTYTGQAGKVVVVTATENALEFGTPSGGGAPLDADYITSAASGTLSAARVLTDTATVTWDFTTAGQAKANAVAGSGTATPIGATVTRTTSFSVTGSTLTAIPFDTEVVDEGSFWTNAQSTRLTFATPGWYTITASVNWDTTSTTRIVYLRANGTTILAEQSNTGVGDLRQAIALTYKFTAGQYVELAVFVGSTSALDSATCSVATLTSGAGYTTFLSLTDTPDTYTSNALKILRANAAANAVEFGPVLGTMATQNADAVTITGGSATGLTTVDIADLVTGTPATGLRSRVTAGTNRWNLYADGTAPNYLGGNVGIAATPTNARLHLALQAGVYGLITYTTDQPNAIPLEFRNQSQVAVGSIANTGTATSYNTTSDHRLKHAIAMLTGAMERVRALRPVSFRWNADDSSGVGFLAHELQQVVPEAVTGLPDEVNDDGSIKPQQVDMSKLIPLLTAGLQAALAQIDALTARISTLEEALGL